MLLGMHNRYIQKALRRHIVVLVQVFFSKIFSQYFWKTEIRYRKVGPHSVWKDNQKLQNTVHNTLHHLYSSTVQYSSNLMNTYSFFTQIFSIEYIQSEILYE